MSKAEKFISDYTRNCSNVFINPQLGGTEENHPWLTPDQARRAVEIARAEIYQWLVNHYRDYMYNPTGKQLEAFFGGNMINDLKQAMKNE